MIGATRSVPRRTVTVTPVFEAVTARMLSQSARVRQLPLFPRAISRQGPPCRGAPGAALKTRTREVGFQVLTGSASIILPRLRRELRGRSWASPPVRRRLARKFTLRGRTAIRSSRRRSRLISSGPIRGLWANSESAASSMRATSMATTAVTQGSRYSDGCGQKAEIEGLLRQIRN